VSEKELEKPATERALALRQRHKSKKPKFRRQESWRYKRVSEVWRKPDGVDSKMRKKVKGWPKSAEIGYRGPRVARGLHPSGYEEVLVRTVDDLGKVDPKTQAIRIAHTVGMKKRAEISIRAGERGVRILNPLPEVKPEEEAEEAPKETEAKTEAEEATEKKEEEEKRS
jgi:large subunit ribosomal protein L32e